MSRDHSSVPLKSNALNTPVPVITNTRLPSVTGDGDDMFCLRIIVLPPPSAFFQSTSPLVRSTAHSDSESLSASATFRKMVSPQMIGVAPLRSGIASFQVTFSSLVQVDGRPFSALRPLADGPRHAGQFSAETAVVASVERNRADTNRRAMDPPENDRCK